jgi:RNA polymerase sigma factor (sigma-70 family)
MAAETLGDETDRQLVQRLLASRDEAAFEALVRRHGTMVYRVCWRILHQSQDAEDAFQATFLLLARKLVAIRKHESVASWLHGVARRAALKAKAEAARRRHHERKAANVEVVPSTDLSWKELRTVLDAELEGLPEKWRLPLILCYLESRTQDEAAHQLKWSKSTMRRRLEEAREALGRRLARRGFACTAAFGGPLLSDCLTWAAIPPNLANATVDAGVKIVTGQTVARIASTNVIALTEGVLQAMFPTKLKIAAAAVLLAVFSLGALVMMAQANGVPSGDEKPLPQVAGSPAPLTRQPAKGDAQKDVEKLQGVWKVLSYVWAGNPQDGSDGQPTQLVFQKDLILFKGADEREATYRLDVTKKPRQIDMTISEKGKKITFPGIYHLEGDTLKICFNTCITDSGKEPEGRPNEFKSTPDTPLTILTTLKREKP